SRGFDRGHAGSVLPRVGWACTRPGGGSSAGRDARGEWPATAPQDGRLQRVPGVARKDAARGWPDVPRQGALRMAHGTGIRELYRIALRGMLMEGFRGWPRRLRDRVSRIMAAGGRAGMNALIRCAMLMAALWAGGCTQATFKPP